MRDRYSEQLALTLLKKHFAEYQGLELSDKPDLIDEQNSIGVEVTRAINSTVEEREAYFSKHMKNRRKNEFTTKQIENVEQCGLGIVCENSFDEADDEKMLGLVRVFGIEEYEQLHCAIRNKHAKKYVELDRIDLYIYFRQVCPSGLSDFEINKIFQTVYECEKKYGQVFSKIMIDFHSVLKILDLKNKSVKEINDYGE